MRSIMQADKRCYLCHRNGSEDPLEIHHCFGAANRKFSDEDGLVVWLCGNRCHRNGRMAVHRNRAVSDFLKMEAQRAWEKNYGSRADFVQRYGKNYLEVYDGN